MSRESNRGSLLTNNRPISRRRIHTIGQAMLNWTRNVSFDAITRHVNTGKVSSRLWMFLYILVAGQITSLTITGLGVFTTLFDNHTGKDISTTFSAGAYFILSATAGPYVAYQPDFVGKLRRHWWKFVIIGLSDFYTIYLQTLAFSYTSISSNLLITSGVYTFSVIILALFMTKTRYKLIHFVAIIISTSGMVIVIWQDLTENDNTGSNPVLGDVLCVGAGFLYAVTIVSEELLIKGKLGIAEFLAFLGFSGATVSGIQLCVLDRVTLTEVEWTLRVVLYFLGYHICNYCYYIFIAYLIVKSSSMVASLSVLTTNVYTLIFAIFLFDNKFSVFYIGGFIIIMFGLVLYNIIPTPEGGTDQSVFGTGYWYNYGHSLFCEWRCCPQHVRLVVTNNNSDDVDNDHDEVDVDHDDSIRLVPVSNESGDNCDIALNFVTNNNDDYGVNVDNHGSDSNIRLVSVNGGDHNVHDYAL